jgi:hypothetical protein
MRELSQRTSFFLFFFFTFSQAKEPPTITTIFIFFFSSLLLCLLAFTFSFHHPTNVSFLSLVFFVFMWARNNFNYVGKMLIIVLRAERFQIEQHNFASLRRKRSWTEPWKEFVTTTTTKNERVRRRIESRFHFVVVVVLNMKWYDRYLSTKKKVNYTRRQAKGDRLYEWVDDRLWMPACVNSIRPTDFWGNFFLVSLSLCREATWI